MMNTHLTHEQQAVRPFANSKESSMKRYATDRPNGWPALAAGHRRHDGGSTMYTIPADITYDLIDRRMHEASNARLAAVAASERTRDGVAVRFRGRLGHAITAFGRALGGEPARSRAASVGRKAVAPAGRGIAEPGC
jgi:hypothetical protein